MAQQQFSRRICKGADGTADTASHQGLFDSHTTKNRVVSAAGTGKVDTSAPVAAQRFGVVLFKAVKPALAILRARLSLCKLRAQIAVLALQRPDPFSKKGQALAQDRRRAVLVDQRLHHLQQAVAQFVLRGNAKNAHGTKGGAAHESTDTTALTHKAVEALRNRAITGLLINSAAAVTPTSEAGFNFWNGYAKALQDLSDGTGATLSAKDARLSGYEAPRYFQGAFAALAVHTEPLTLAKVQQVLAANGVQIPIDSVADGQINAGQQLENSAGMVIDLNDDHAAAVVDGDDGSLHGGASLAATVAQEGGAA